MGSTVGTPYYMAPEQAKGQAIDHRADLYATAVVLYEMLTGRLPFDDEDHRVAMQKIARGQPPTLRSLRPELDPALEQVVLKAMATRREARYDTADEFADALAPFSLSPETLERSGPRVETPELRSGAVGDGADAVVPPGPLDMTDKTVVDIRRWRGLLAAIVSGATIITVVAAVIGVIVTRRQCAQEESQFPAELIAGSVAPRDAGVVEAGTESTDAEAEATPTAASSRDGGTSVDRSKVVAALRLLRPAVEPCLKGTRRARTKVHLHFRIAADGDINYRSSRPPLPRRAEQCLRKALRGRHMDSTGTDPFVATYTYRVPR